MQATLVPGLKCAMLVADASFFFLTMTRKLEIQDLHTVDLAVSLRSNPATFTSVFNCICLVTVMGSGTFVVVATVATTALVVQVQLVLKPVADIVLVVVAVRHG